MRHFKQLSYFVGPNSDRSRATSALSEVFQLEDGQKDGR